jgi:nitrite reductase (NADH) small subunit
MQQDGFVLVARRGDVARDRSRVVRVGRYDVALFDVDGEVFAYENVCPHQGGPIAEGFIEGSTITCPWHAWCFDLRTGSMTIGDFARLRRFDVTTEGDAIYVASEPREDA